MTSARRNLAHGPGYQLFRDRRQAGRQLAAELTQFKEADPVVLALPRGGVVVGAEIARALEAPLDVVLVRKIGHPQQPELAIGAIADGTDPEIALVPELAHLDLPPDYMTRQAARELAEIERRRTLYLGGRPRPSVAGRTAIMVDDGIATGATVRAALRALRKAGPARLVLAVPAAPADTLRALDAEADEIVCLAVPDPFYAVGQVYSDFRQIEDEEVVTLLDEAGRRQAGRTG